MTSDPVALRQKVIEVISCATLVPVESLTLEERPEDLGIDSLGLVESIFALEETFDIKVPFNAHQGAGLDVSTLGAIVQGIERLIQARQPA